MHLNNIMIKTMLCSCVKRLGKWLLGQEFKWCQFGLCENDLLRVSRI